MVGVTCATVAPEEWDRVIPVDLSGAFRMAQETARRLLARGAPGAIVSVASGQAYRPALRGGRPSPSTPAA